MSKHEWKWNWQQEDGEADCGISYEEQPGMAYSVCRAPRYATKEQWEATATLICKAVNCHSGLVAACKWFMEKLNDNTLVRDISWDHKSDFYIRMMTFVRELNKAKNAIAKAEETP